MLIVKFKNLYGENKNAGVNDDRYSWFCLRNVASKSVATVVAAMHEWIYVIEKLIRNTCKYHIKGFFVLYFKY